MRRKNAMLRVSFNSKPQNGSEEPSPKTSQNTLANRGMRAMSELSDLNGSNLASAFNSKSKSISKSKSKSRSGDLEENRVGGVSFTTSPKAEKNQKRATFVTTNEKEEGRKSIQPEKLSIAIPGDNRPKSSISKSRSASRVRKNSSTDSVTPSVKMHSIHNGMHASMHGRKSITFGAMDIQAAAAGKDFSLSSPLFPKHSFLLAAVAAVGGLGEEPEKPAARKRNNKTLSGKGAYIPNILELDENEKKQIITDEVDDIIESMKEKHSLENALKSKKVKGTKLIDTLSAAIHHSRNLF